MNIAIFGYGKMGREIEKLALDRKHEVVLRIDENNISSISKNDFKKVDVVIEFSTPESAFSNINLCFDNNMPVVSGTTGWIGKIDEIINRCKTENKTFFYASNFSLGVNLFFKLNKYLAKLTNNFSDYNVKIEETHHSQKLDAPSGTAITIAEGIIENMDRKNNWEKEKSDSKNTIPIKSFREGTMPGNHKVIYDSLFDKISIEHDSKSRKAFALGAVLAAEFIVDKKGYFTMDDLLKF
ncbi:MAG: 4-hydroxy-tetrahydrodipicolinate reductase [Bacteroidales bacterium]|nr:4-hydroxy-tetrahydrodipicolinate reductase [Bacteroidales bacterium]